MVSGHSGRKAPNTGEDSASIHIYSQKDNYLLFIQCIVSRFRLSGQVSYGHRGPAGKSTMHGPPRRYSRSIS